jgi:hypothetical protein
MSGPDDVGAIVVPGCDVERVLGRGGFATVYQASRGGDRVVVKVALASGTAAATRLGRERRLLERIGGNDTCDGEAGYTSNSLATADALRVADIKTIVVGFDGSATGISVSHLNNLACAGGLAAGPAENCIASGDQLRAPARRPPPAELFLRAEDQAGLTSALMGVAATVACDPDIVQ